MNEEGELTQESIEEALKSLEDYVVGGGVTMFKYQRLARTTAVYPFKGSNINYPMIGLAGEVGEAANIVKRIQRDDSGIVMPEAREKLMYELGDILWYVASLASEAGLNLEDIAAENLRKLFDRKARGKLRGEGDKR